MTEHTKGPWTLETVKTSIGSCHKIGPFQCCIYDDYRWPGMDSENLANARLIAAAPELLEACKAALGAFEHNHAIDWSDLERAISKASSTGEVSK